MITNTLRGEGEITLGDKKFVARLNMNAFRIMAQRFDVQLEDLDAYMQANQLNAIAALGWCGIKAGEASYGRKFDMDFDLFCGVFLDNEDGMIAITELISGSTTGTEESESGNE